MNNIELLRNSDPSLTTLELFGIQIGVEGSRSIAEALCHNTTLITLYLVYDHIGVEGARAIAEALRSNTTLITLNLSYNHIGIEGVRAIAEVNTKRTKDAKKLNNNHLTLLLGTHDPFSFIYQLPCDGCILQQIIRFAQVYIPSCQIKT